MMALNANSTGNYNTAVGMVALNANSTGSENTALGYDAQVTNGHSNSTAIGSGAYVDADNKIVLGDGNVTSIGGAAAWTNYSDRRLKENIVYTNKLGLNFITRLKPVSYNYIKDTNKRRRDGLIAQDVQQTLKELGLEFSGLVIDDDKDKTMNLSYAEFVIPIITAVQELNQKNQLLEQKNQQSDQANQQLQQKVQALEAALNEMKAEIKTIKQSIQSK
jgi:hypothetical protein